MRQAVSKNIPVHFNESHKRLFFFWFWVFVYEDIASYITYQRMQLARTKSYIIDT